LAPENRRKTTWMLDIRFVDSVCMHFKPPAKSSNCRTLTLPRASAFGKP
jgi:hypothetical protein